jgi:hypothetical protein
MKDTRTGAGRQKPVKGAVDKAGKRGMPKPETRPVKQEKKPSYGPAAKAAEARKELRRGEKGKAPRGEAAPRKAPPPAPKAQAPRPARATGAVGTPKGKATEGPVKATARPLPKGVATKRPAGRGPVASRGPTPSSPVSFPDIAPYNPFAGR